jgi:hypothetical protein
LNDNTLCLFGGCAKDYQTFEELYLIKIELRYDMLIRKKTAFGLVCVVKLDYLNTFKGF